MPLIFNEFLNNEISVEEIENLLAGIGENNFIKKDDILIGLNDTEDCIHIIRSGIVRLYYKYGRTDVIIDFAGQGEVICSLESLFAGKPSRFIIKAITDTNTLTFGKAELEKMSSSNPDIKILVDTIIASMITRLLNKDIESSIQSSERRLRHWIYNRAELLNRIPLMYIASYLKIRQETVSRLKGQIIHKF